MSVATATTQGESYLYGGVLFQRVTETEREARPLRAGLLTCLSQGLATGAVLMFVLTAGVLLYEHNNGYQYLVVVYFPLYLCFGLVPGLVEGLVSWICMRMTGHNLRWFTRLLIAALVLAIPYVALLLVFSSADATSSKVTELVTFILIVGAIGAMYGPLTGSRFSPWHQLVRGDESLPSGSWVVTGLTGFVLRVAVVFFLMEAILSFIVTLQSGSWQNDVVWTLSLLLHFVFAFVIVFARLKFWLLLPLALIINVPIVFFLQNYLLKEAWDIFIYLCIGYLAAWATFLIARCPLTYWIVDFFKEEINYYLID